jgi:RNA polymerase subunit RPABC4/transcription elongation factor Spt4
MSVGTLLIGLAMLVIATALVARPLLNKGRRAAPDAEPELETGYQDVLLALRDLELDHQAGVIADEDYASLHSQLLAEAAQMLAAEEEAAAPLHEQIEAAVSAYRRTRTRGQSGPTCSGCGGALAAGDKFCPQCGMAALICPQCGQAHDPQHKFCPACGTSLTVLMGAAV